MNKRNREPSKKELQQSYNELKSTRNVAKQIGVSPLTIRNWMKECGIERNRNSDINQLEKFLEQYAGRVDEK